MKLQSGLELEPIGMILGMTINGDIEVSEGCDMSSFRYEDIMTNEDRLFLADAMSALWQEWARQPAG